MDKIFEVNIGNGVWLSLTALILYAVSSCAAICAGMGVMMSVLYGKHLRQLISQAGLQTIPWASLSLRKRDGNSVSCRQVKPMASRLRRHSSSL